jgi:hypothetical protein
MKKYLAFLLLISTSAFATPKQGVDYTYETIKHSQDIIRHPDEVLIPPEADNDDYKAYKHWRLFHPFVSDYHPAKPTKKEK